MIIQYASDLHLEQMENYCCHDLLSPKGHVLILAGDICHIDSIEQYKKFFDYVSSHFQYVLYVPGNHEFYSSFYNYQELEVMIKKFLYTYPNIFYLNNSSIVINKILFTGTCLWCTPNVEPPQWFNCSLNKAEINQLYNNSLSYLSKLSNLNYPNHVVITHYPPIFLTLKKQRFNPIYDCYYQNETILLNYQPRYWIFGHIHENICLTFNKTIYLSNQRKDRLYNKNSFFIL